MSNSIMYQEDGYVLLETDQPEQLLAAAELQEKLQTVIQSHWDELSAGLRQELEVRKTLDQQARYLRHNYCELKLDSGEYWQWYVVRFQK
ncbi:MAG: chlororespiratory reduction protein 7 [Chloroflexaceae bacterium]|nr:chlororespiratory reduction protein 7 [Chloroflexaceae bacterium]